MKYKDAEARGLLMEHHCALDPLFESSFSLTASRLSSQSEVNDFIHDLNLSKYQSEVMFSSSESCTLLEKVTMAYFFSSSRQKVLFIVLFLRNAI
jgi:hypothetical protein